MAASLARRVESGRPESRLTELPCLGQRHTRGGSSVGCAKTGYVGRRTRRRPREGKEAVRPLDRRGDWPGIRRDCGSLSDSRSSGRESVVSGRHRRRSVEVVPSDRHTAGTALTDGRTHAEHGDCDPISGHPGVTRHTSRPGPRRSGPRFALLSPPEHRASSSLLNLSSFQPHSYTRYYTNRNTWKVLDWDELG